MRRFVVSLCLLAAVQLSAQSTTRDEVLAVVNRVFEAMRTNDSTLLKTCFTSNVQMSTVMTDANGVTQLKEGTLAQFMEAVAKPKALVLNEPTWNEHVQVDGPLAAVWAEYAFYLSNTFSHCGVDAFHLVKTAEGWKIFNLVDTRRKEGCNVPEEVRARFDGK